jgi:hypothetical protein
MVFAVQYAQGGWLDGLFRGGVAVTKGEAALNFWAWQSRLLCGTTHVFCQQKVWAANVRVSDELNVGLPREMLPRC